MRTMRVLSTMIAAGVQGVVYNRSHAVEPEPDIRAAEVLIRPTTLAKCNLHFISA